VDGRSLHRTRLLSSSLLRADSLLVATISMSLSLDRPPPYPCRVECGSTHCDERVSRPRTNFRFGSAASRLAPPGHIIEHPTASRRTHSLIGTLAHGPAYGTLSTLLHRVCRLFPVSDTTRILQRYASHGLPSSAHSWLSRAVGPRTVSATSLVIHCEKLPLAVVHSPSFPPSLPFRLTLISVSPQAPTLSVPRSGGDRLGPRLPNFGPP